MTFYRIHWAGSLPFTAANAWSALWGSTRSSDGTQTECHSCVGTGRDGGCTHGEPCTVCDGTGWEDALEGYSCTDTAEELIDYFTCPGRSGVVGADDRVIVFEGIRAGTGFDGEPLAVPTRILEELTWTEFLTRQS